MCPDVHHIAATHHHRITLNTRILRVTTDRRKGLRYSLCKGCAAPTTLREYIPKQGPDDKVAMIAMIITTMMIVVIAAITTIAIRLHGAIRAQYRCGGSRS